MTNSNTSLRRASIIAGAGILIMAILAPLANFYILPTLIIPGDITTTVNNIIASEWLFRIGICCFLIVIILDVIVAWALYVLLAPASKSISMLAAWFRIIYAAILAIALSNLFGALQLLMAGDYSKVLTTNQLHAQVMLLLNSFNYTWDIGLALFGLHLAMIGYLSVKSGYVPRIIGFLVMVAGLGYLTDGLGRVLLPHYGLVIAMFTFVGEVLFMLWLLFWGGKNPLKD